uniref:Uncharacterized protein n=1 Tax=Arundo donax TaxID=35708 RepID=A0A0A9GYK3_ARUDO
MLQGQSHEVHITVNYHAIESFFFIYLISRARSNLNHTIDTVSLIHVVNKWLIYIKTVRSWITP